MNSNTSDIVSTRQPFSFCTTGREKKEWSNTKDLFENSRKNKKKRKRGYLCACPCSCPCLIGSVLIAILLSTAVAAALLALLFKSEATTTRSATLSITTITGTTISTTTLAIATTLTNISSTTTISTTISTTATTTTVCGTPTSTIMSFIGPTSATPSYSYASQFTGQGVLQFGFTSVGSNKIAYLDDVSIVDTNTSNSEMLINGGFENGSLIGWQRLCSLSCTTLSGNLSTTSCNTGSYCYADGCRTGTDFVRQTYSTIIGHIYTLSFSISVANTQTVHIEIF